MDISIYDFVYYLTFIAMIVALVSTWKYECSRYFLLFLFGLEAIDDAILPITLTWTTHFYLYCIVFDLIFCIPIIYRKHIAYWIYQKTHWNFFRRVYNNHHLALQEIGLLMLFGVDIAINFIVYIEVWLYKWKFLDQLFIKNNIRLNVVLFINFFTLCALVTYAAKARAREEFYRTNKAPESSTI